MGNRRVWYITVRWAVQSDGRVDHSAVHWSPPKESWPVFVHEAVDELDSRMEVALADGYMAR